MTRRILPSHPDYADINYWQTLHAAAVNAHLHHDTRTLTMTRRVVCAEASEKELARLLEGGAFRDYVDGS